MENIDSGSAAALRAWYQGLSTREAVERYLPGRLTGSCTARGVLGQLRRELAREARVRSREDLAALFECPAALRTKHASNVQIAVDTLFALPARVPFITDPVERWVPARASLALEAAGIRSLADLTVRVPRRRRWWSAIPGLGAASARRIEAFFAANPELTNRARELLAQSAHPDIAPLEQQAPSTLDGAAGKYRAPASQCLLAAQNDLEAVRAWLDLHEAGSTRRAYRKEAERLILWAIHERKKPMSSLTSEDAVAYRAFLRDPRPHGRWVGPSRPCSSSEWRPFAGPLSGRSIAYSLSIIAALFRWLVAQRYLLANPFAGLKVRGAERRQVLDAQRSFTEGEWALLRAIADGLELSYGWERAAAERLRFVLDFCYATGLRAGELVELKLRSIRADHAGERWIHVVGKGAKKGRVAVPPLASGALERYLWQRGLPTSMNLWVPDTPVLGSLGEDASSITAARLWAVLKRFFTLAADELSADAPGLAEKLRKASPHWMRHTHASHALGRGADLTAVRDNLRHASIGTTSTYLHGEDSERAKQMAAAFKRKQ